MALCKSMLLVGALLLIITLSKRMKQVGDVSPHQPEELRQHMGEHTMDEMHERQEELAEALVEEDMSNGLTGTVEEAAEEEAEPVMAPEPRADTANPRKGKQGHPEGIAKRGKGTEQGTEKGVDADKEKEHKLVKGLQLSSKNQGTLMRKLGGGVERQMRFPVSTSNGKWWLIRLAFMRGQFAGFIYKEVPSTKTLLIKSWKAAEDFGDEVILPLWGNYVGAKVGDKITFDIGAMAQEGEGKPRPMATNVNIRQSDNEVREEFLLAPPPTDVRTQILYYMSDKNLRTDKFFQDIIAATEGGWISFDFLLLCKRLKELGASKQSIMDALQDAPGLEVRDIPGQEAIRRKRRAPRLVPGTVARKEVEFPALEDPFADKKMYSLEAMMSMGLPSDNDIKMLEQKQQELAKVASSERNKQKRLLAVEKAVVQAGAAKEQKNGPTKRKAADDGRRTADKTRPDSKTKEKAKKAAVEKVAARKAAGEKPAAKKALAVDVGKVAAENVEAEKAAAFAKRKLLEQAAAEEAVTEHAAAEKKAEAAVERAPAETAVAPAATSDNQKSWASWFSKLPRAAWGYVAGKTESEKKEDEKNADDFKEHQPDTHEKSDLTTE